MTERTPDPRKTQDPIPQSVIDVLAEVRDSGECNMLDRTAVIYFAFDIDSEAGLWLKDNPKRYMEALIEMGEQS